MKRAFDPTWAIMIFASVYFYAVLAYFIFLITGATIEQYATKMISNFDFNSFASTYMGVGIFFVFADLIRKYLSDPKEFVADTTGKLAKKTSKKTVLWICSSIFFLLNTLIFFYTNKALITAKIDLTSLAFNFFIITSAVILAESGEAFFAFLPSPIQAVLASREQLFEAQAAAQPPAKPPAQNTTQN